jgi:streptothricin acetyltransferase
VIHLRPLRLADIPNLPQIRPTYTSETILRVEKSGGGLEVGWRLVEQRLPKPFEKGALYDFDDSAQAVIRARLERSDDAYQQIAEDRTSGRVVGLVEVEIQNWNNTAVLANLMIDLDYRGQGLGRRLWRRALDFARQAEVRAMLIETQNTNVHACKFYAQMGCQLVGVNEAFYTNDGQNSEIALFWAYLFSDLAR